MRWFGWDGRAEADLAKGLDDLMAGRAELQAANALHATLIGDLNQRISLHELSERNKDKQAADLIRERAELARERDHLKRDLGHFHELVRERGYPTDVEPQGMVGCLRHDLTKGDEVIVISQAEARAAAVAGLFLHPAGHPHSALKTLPDLLARDDESAPELDMARVLDATERLISQAWNPEAPRPESEPAMNANDQDDSPDPEDIEAAVGLLESNGYIVLHEGCLCGDEGCLCGIDEVDDHPLPIDPGRASLFFEFKGDNEQSAYSLPARSIESIYTFQSDSAVTTSVNYLANGAYERSATSIEPASALTARLNALLEGTPNPAEGPP